MPRTFQKKLVGGDGYRSNYSVCFGPRLKTEVSAQAEQYACSGKKLNLSEFSQPDCNKGGNKHDQNFFLKHPVGPSLIKVLLGKLREGGQHFSNNSEIQKSQIYPMGTLSQILHSLIMTPPLRWGWGAHQLHPCCDFLGR